MGGRGWDMGRAQWSPSTLRPWTSAPTVGSERADPGPLPLAILGKDPGSTRLTPLRPGTQEEGLIIINLANNPGRSFRNPSLHKSAHPVLFRVSASGATHTYQLLRLETGCLEPRWPFLHLGSKESSVLLLRHRHRLEAHPCESAENLGRFQGL
jgi:hypothetical protein